MKKKQVQSNSSNRKLYLNKTTIAKLAVPQQSLVLGGDPLPTMATNCQTNTGENCDAKKCILGSKVKV